MHPTSNINLVGVRPIISEGEADDVFKVLKKREKIVESTTWNRRYREYMDKIKTGSVIEVAKVLRDLCIIKGEKGLCGGAEEIALQPSLLCTFGEKTKNIWWIVGPGIQNPVNPAPWQQISNGSWALTASAANIRTVHPGTVHPGTFIQIQALTDQLGTLYPDRSMHNSSTKVPKNATDCHRPGVSGKSRSRPFSGIRASDSCSQSLGKNFCIRVPVPKGWECSFDSCSCSQNLGMQLSIPVPVSGNGLSRQE